jgi:hypothetical protein
VNVSSSSTSARPSPKRSRAASAASATAMSGGSASKPQTWTIFTPACSARAPKSTFTSLTNGISPLRSM